MRRQQNRETNEQNRQEKKSQTRENSTQINRKYISNLNIHQPQFSKPVGLKSSKGYADSEMSSQEFSNLIFKSMKIVPDVPLEVSDYKPQHAYQTPAYYPQTPNGRLLQPDFFILYDVSTLFYIFFYFPGTQQQMSAGKELQQRGWIYHPKYQTWFHRTGNPTEQTDKYEIGEFDYFDHTTPDCWCVRHRNSFKLEYECLDNE